MILHFEVPGPPVPCARARVVTSRKTGKVMAYTPKETSAYKKHVRTIAHAALYTLLAKTNRPWPTSSRYSVRLEFWLPDERRRDWDNLAKGVVDACTPLLWADDSQIVRAHVEKHIDRGSPRAEMRIQVLECIAVDANRWACTREAAHDGKHFCAIKGTSWED